MVGQRLRTTVVLASLTCGVAAIGVMPASGAGGGVTSRVSVSSSDRQANGQASDFGEDAVSREGRFIAFTSDASNLVRGDTNFVIDVFVRDRLAGVTRRVSISSSGRQADGASGEPAISGNGRFVAFTSNASNLVSGDTNGAQDVFWHDLVTGETRRISVNSAGQQGDFNSFNPAISEDGRSVAFASVAGDLVPRDTNGAVDVFVRDLLPGVTTRVSVSSSGQQGESDLYGELPNSFDPAISADGRFVAFTSAASNLVSHDTNTTFDVFVRDRLNGVTRRVSVSSSGRQASGSDPSISANGRFVAFSSSGSNVVAGDTNETSDVFVYDRSAGVTRRVSVSTSHRQGNGFSESPAISADGRFVAFRSEASNLVSGDTNSHFYGDIFVRDRAAGVTRRVSVSSSGQQANGDSIAPAISADGRSVVFSSNASNLVPRDTNNASDVFAHDPLVGG